MPTQHQTSHGSASKYITSVEYNRLPACPNDKSCIHVENKWSNMCGPSCSMWYIPNINNDIFRISKDRYTFLFSTWSSAMHYLNTAKARSNVPLNSNPINLTFQYIYIILYSISCAEGADKYILNYCAQPCRVLCLNIMNIYTRTYTYAYTCIYIK